MPNIDGTLIPTADMTKMEGLHCKPKHNNVPSMLCILKFLLIQVYLRFGTLTGLLL